MAGPVGNRPQPLAPPAYRPVIRHSDELACGAGLLKRRVDWADHRPAGLASSVAAPARWGAVRRCRSVTVGSVRLGLDKLIDSHLAPYVDESRAFRAERAGARGPRTLNELQEARARRSAEVASDPPAVQAVIKTGGSSVPIRIFTPVAAEPCGVLFDIHGGGFLHGLRRSQ
jgi:acetyl esterase/lipase